MAVLQAACFTEYRGAVARRHHRTQADSSLTPRAEEAPRRRRDREGAHDSEGQAKKRLRANRTKVPKSLAATSLSKLEGT
jgi:hypothetical protein